MIIRTVHDLRVALSHYPDDMLVAAPGADEFRLKLIKLSEADISLVNGNPHDELTHFKEEGLASLAEDYPEDAISSGRALIIDFEY